MRIGELAKKYNIHQSTIRFYIKTGILLPVKKNSQYVFTPDDEEDLKTVIVLKNNFFSLEEIQKYLHIKRLYNSDDTIENSHFISILEEKIKNIKQEITYQKRAINTLEEMLNQLEHDSISNAKKQLDSLHDVVSGIPIEFAVNFMCPKCGSLIDLREISIHNNRIINGKLMCRCGYTAVIEDGIILTPNQDSFYTSDDFYIMHYREKPSDKQDFVFFEYMNDLSTDTVNLMYSAYNYIDEYLTNTEFRSKVIILPDLACHFLYKNLANHYFDDAFIIVSGFSKHNISAIKSHIDVIKPEAKIIYIANTIYDLPIKKQIIDLWIDCNSSYNFGFFHPYSLHEKLFPYMKNNSRIVGYSKYYDDNAKSLKNIRRLYPKSMSNHGRWTRFKRTLEEQGYKLCFSEIMGSTTNPGPYYEYHDSNDSYFLFTYVAEPNK